jgi:DNA polymerase III gamma/tau subunit
MIDLAFGATGRNYANAIIDAVLAQDAAQTLRTIEEASDAGADMVVLIRALIANFRNLLVARIDPELLARDLAPEDAERATARAANVGQPTIVRALRVLSDAASLARSGGNPRLELETALLRFILEAEGADAAPAPAPAVKATPAPAPAPKSAPAPTPTPPKPAPVAEKPVAPAPKPASAPKADGPITIQKLRAAWTTVRGRLEAERPSLRAPLSGAMVESVDAGTATLKLRSKFEADILKDHLKLVEAAIADVLGSSLHVRLETGAAANAAPPADPIPVDDEESADELFGYANERIK